MFFQIFAYLTEAVIVYMYIRHIYEPKKNKLISFITILVSYLMLFFIYRFIIALESLPSPRVSPRLWLLSGCRLVRPCSGSRPRLFHSKLAVSVYGGCSDRSDLRYPFRRSHPGPPRRNGSME